MEQEPESLHTAANRLRAWTLFSIIAVISLIPYAYVLIAAPAPSRGLDETMNILSCGWQGFLAVLIGAIGGSTRQWRMTLAGTFVLVSASVVFAYIIALQKSLGTIPNPLLMFIPLMLGYTLMLVPACAVHAMVALKRQTKSVGYCDVCDYNLTGNVSGRCPECGTPVKRESVSS